MLLAACGGSESNPSQGNNTGGNQSGNPLFSLNESDKKAHTALAISVSESMLQLAQYSDQLINQVLQPDNTTTDSCHNGGSRVLIFSSMTAGNSITEQLTNCHLPALNAIVSGDIELKLKSFELLQNNRFTATVELNLENALFKESPGFQLKRPITIKLRSELLHRYAKVQPASQFIQLIFDDGETFVFRDFTLESHIDFTTARYQSEFSGQLESNAYRSALTVSTPLPMSGFIREYPYQGEMKLVDSLGNQLYINVEDRPYPHALDVRFNNNTTSRFMWWEISEGSFWIWPGVVDDKFDIEPYHPDNMQVIGTLENLQQKNFAPNDTFHVLFSRPVKQIVESSAVPRFRPNRHGISEVPAQLTVLGAAVMVTPTSPLKPRVNYRLPSFIGANEGGIEVPFVSNHDITVSDDLIAVISANRTAFTSMDTIELSAEDSVQNHSGELTYHWREISQSGVQFDHDDRKQVKLIFPATIPASDVVIELQLKHSDGTEHHTQTTLYYYDNSMSVLYVDVKQPSDPLAKPQTLFIFDGAYDDSSSNRYNTNLGLTILTHVDGETQYQYLTLRLSNSNEDDLAPGHYSQAQAFDFLPTGFPGLFFAGAGFQCNYFESGEFEIFDIEFETIAHGINWYSYPVTRLAADFIQRCADDGHEYHGKIRFNTDIPLFYSH